MTTQRYARIGVLVGLGLAILSIATLGAPGKDPGGYVSFSYRTVTREGLVEDVTTWIVPGEDGTYRVVTRTEMRVGADEIRIGFSGAAMRSLGLYSSQGSGVDLAWLGGVGGLGIEPGKKYLLPDGGVLQTGERVTVVGLTGIEGVFTHTGDPAVKITVVIADDPELRDLLPFPLRITIEYDYTRLGTSDPDEVPQSGSMELVAFTRDPQVGGLP